MKRFIVIGAFAGALAMLSGPVGQVRNAMALVVGGAKTCTTRICVGTVCTSSVPNMRCQLKLTFDPTTGTWTRTCSTVGC